MHVIIEWKTWCCIPTVNKNTHQKNTARPSCQFGENCYRRNPQHKASFAHPGDSDYKDENDGDGSDDDDRPECEYGLQCFRKNPQHKKQYKHTRTPQPQRLAKKKAKQKRKTAAVDNDDSEEDEYDLNDSFLNDDSSDDYAPTDSDSGDEYSQSQEVQDSDEEQEIKRMVKEAKKFVKKK